VREGDANKNPVLVWIQGHQVGSAVIGLVLIVVLGLGLSSLGGGDPVDEAVVDVTSTSVTGAATATSVPSATDDPNRPEVPQVDCRSLLTTDEIDVALFGEDATGPRGSFTFAQGETCLSEPDDDTGNYIQIEPGDPADFDEGAQLSGVFGERVDGVGDAARWFNDGAGLGILSVGVGIEEASVIYRVHINRSDLDGAQRLGLARDLALLALHRFPGTGPAAPEPRIDLCELVTDEQAEEILAEYRDAHPATRDEILVSENFSDLVDLSEEGDANCQKLILAEIYIETQQGSPSDLEVGASMEGVTAQTVAGVGAEAAWFADVPYQGSFTAPHERGVLAVRVGDATFRIVLALPDTPTDDLLEIARNLAEIAIPRIPGVPPPEQEAETVTFDEEPPVLPPQSLHEVVYDGVTAGDWTEGEGLIQALEWMLDDTSGFVAGELSDQSRTAVIRAAQGYVAGGGDQAGLVGQLLDDVQWTGEELAQSAVPVDATERGLLVSALPVAQEEPLGCPGGQNECVIEIPLGEFDGLDQDKHKAYVFMPSQWGLEGLDSPVVDAFADAVRRFEELGDMPPTGLMLALGNGTWAAYDLPSGTCAVNIGENLEGIEADVLLQRVAEETSRCLIGFDLLPQLNENPQHWLEMGLAVYLGGVVYPTLNVEHRDLPGVLSQIELTTPMTLRLSTNWVFWEYLQTQASAQVVMDLMRGLPASGDLAAALAGVPNVPGVFHGLAQAMSDSQLPDIGGGNIPYGPESNQVVLAGPKTFDRGLSRFETNRYRLEVPSGRFACDVEVTADGAEVSWRAGAPGAPGAWSEDVPETLEGDSVLLVTSAQEGATIRFEAAEVGDNPDCEDEDDPSTGNALEEFLDRCGQICDPSSFYWGRIRFEDL
jgi:hypothetical protein